MAFREEEELENVLEEAERKIFDITSNTDNKSDVVAMKDMGEETISRFIHLAENQNEVRGVPTGFRDLDNKLSGFQKSDQEVTLQLDSNNLKLGAAGWINYEEIDEKHLKNVHEQLISNEFTDTDFEDFSDIIMNRSIKKINWIQRMSKDKNTINSYGIFDLLYSLDFSIINLKGTKLRWFIFSVLRKFSENGDNFTFERIYDSFSKWKNLKIQNN